MRVLLMTDMEGCAGVLNFDDWTGPGGRYFENGKRLLTEEVNAAVEGLYEGGVSEILVVDGHGAGGIDPELLDPRVELMRGHAEKVALWGLDKTFDALGFVGQHAKAGTPYSHMTHTQWCNYIDLAINGVSIGEYGQIALCAMELRVPTILACGENAFAAEAQALTPGVLTAAVKRGLLPDGLDHLDTDAYMRAKLSAIHLAPKHARALIRKAAMDAAHKLQKDPSAFHYPKMSPPYVRTARFRKFGDRPAWSARDEHPSSITELMDMPFTKVT